LPRIRCHYIGCVFLDDGFCGSAKVEIDPDTGCATFARADELDVDEPWDDEDRDLNEWDEILDDDEDDLWLDDNL